MLADLRVTRTRLRGAEVEYLVLVDDKPLVFFATREEAVEHAVLLCTNIRRSVRVAQYVDKIETDSIKFAQGDA